jgi:hypothetical protein
MKTLTALAPLCGCRSTVVDRSEYEAAEFFFFPKFFVSCETGPSPDWTTVGIFFADRLY